MILDQITKHFSVIAIVWLECSFHILVVLEQAICVGRRTCKVIQDAYDYHSRPGDMIFPKLAPLIMVRQPGSLLCCESLGCGGGYVACHERDDEYSDKHEHKNRTELVFVQTKHLTLLSFTG